MKRPVSARHAIDVFSKRRKSSISNALFERRALNSIQNQTNIRMAKNTEKKDSRFSSFLDEIKGHISEGAQALSKMSAELIEEVKEKAEELYEAGSEKFEQASGVIESYIDRYKNDMEIKSLQKEKIDLNAKLGDVLYHEFKKNGRISKRFLTTKKMSALFSGIEQVDKKILQKGKELDKKK
jgi:hypothetical protein